MSDAPPVTAAGESDGLTVIILAPPGSDPGLVGDMARQLAANAHLLLSRGGIPSTRREWREWVKQARPGEVRAGARVRQDELAARIGIHPTTLSGWEHGRGGPGGKTGAEWYRAVCEMRAGTGTRRG